MKYLIRSTAVYSGHEELPKPEAFLVEDEVIRKILPYETDGGMLPADTRVLDFGDRLVMPGFIDAHTHFFTGAMENSDHVCSEIADSVSEEDCARIVGEYAAKHPEEKVIRGSGWFLPKWRTTTLPTKKKSGRGGSGPTGSAEVRGRTQLLAEQRGAPAVRHYAGYEAGERVRRSSCGRRAEWNADRAGRV